MVASLLFRGMTGVLLLLLLAIGASAQAPVCEYPCLAVNGCVCNHTDVWNSDGQNFGTCSSCGFGWTGPGCTNVSTQCYNGGKMHVTKYNQSLGCECPLGWSGPQCGDQQCINSINGTGSHKVVPVNSTNACDQCLPGWTGLACDMCTTDAQCDAGQKCITSTIALGKNKSMYCELTSPYWIAAMSYFRPGVRAFATLQCNSSERLVKQYETVASCYISVWRMEPDAAWFDPFFYCTGQNCTLTQETDTTLPPAEAPPPHAALIRSVIMAVIYLLLVLIVANGLLDSKKAGLRFAVLSALLTLTLAGYILFCVFYGHSNSDSAGTRSLTAHYECLHSKCECAPNPPLGKDYDPHCLTSTMATSFFPNMIGKMKVICDQSGACNLEHENLGYVPIPLQCQASECYGGNYTIPNMNPDPPVEDNVGGEAWVIVALVVAFVWFVWYSLRTARFLAQEFYRRFDGGAYSTTNSLGGIQQQDGALNDASPLLGSSGDVLRVPDARPADIADDDSVDEVQLDLEDGAYSVKAKQILQGASISFRSGEMVAIMGASGAGKTTLLDILSRRDKEGIVEGTLAINGERIDRSNEPIFKRLVGFVAQSDNLIPALTVRQTIHFAAKLKLPAAIPDDVIHELVEDVIAKLHLTRCVDTPIGSDTSRGVSGGEKRRVSIATELVANPRVLFLDEPTSGLDSVSATDVMRAIANLTRTSQIRRFRKFFELRPCVIFSIHQPSAEIFALFDRLVVVSHGRITYSGPAKEAVNTILQIRGISGTPSAVNDAETILRLDHEATPEDTDNLAAAVPKPQLYQPTLATAGSKKHHLSPNTTTSIIEYMRRNKKYYPNLVQQFILLSKRTWCSLLGSYYLVMCHAAATVFLGIVLSLLYQKEKLDLAGTEDKAGMVTFLLLVVGFSSISCLDLFISEKRLYVLERDNGYYRSGAFYVVKLIFDFIPLRIFPAAILGAVTYFPMGLRNDKSSYFLNFVAILVVFQLFLTGICLCIATVVPTFGAGALFAALVILWHSAFGGLLMQSSTIPIGLAWCKYLSPFYYAYEALMINELDGLSCIFNPANAEGNDEGVVLPIPCNQFLYNMGLNPANFGRDVTALCAWLSVYVLLGAVLIHFLRVKV